MISPTVFLALNGAMIGICLYLAYLCLREAYRSYMKIKKMGDGYAQLKLAREISVCKGPHSWEPFELAFPQIPIGKHSVCKDCGFIGGTGYQLNRAGVEILQNHLIRTDRRLQIQAEFAKKRIQAYYDVGLNAVLAVRLDCALDKIDVEEDEALNKV